MPTILEYLNISQSENFEKIDGESLFPLIKGESIEEKYAFSETGNPLKDKRPPENPNTKSIRSSKWKLIINEYDNSKEIYNLELDASETNNLIGTNLDIEEILWKEIQQYL